MARRRMRSAAAGMTPDLPLAENTEGLLRLAYFHAHEDGALLCAARSAYELADKGDRRQLLLCRDVSAWATGRLREEPGTEAHVLAEAEELNATLQAFAVVACA